MAIENKIEVWQNAGVEPDDKRKALGFEGGYYPPAGIFNWLFHNMTAAIKEQQDRLGEDGSLSVENGGTGASDPETAFEILSFRQNVSDDNISNCNNLKDCGNYRVYITDASNAKNYNYPGRYGTLTTHNTNGYIAQTFYAVSEFKTYVRYSSNNGSTWSSWKVLFDSSNIPSLADMTGMLTIAHGGTSATTEEGARTNLHLNLRSYVGFKQIGVTTGEETIEGIVAAMPNCSELICDVGSLNAKIYPSSYGVLRVIKTDNTRTMFYFYLKGNNVVYYGNYDGSLPEPWKGWVTEYNSGNLPIPAYNHNTLELTTEDLNTLKTEGFYVAAGNNTCTNTPFPAGTSFGLEVKRTAGSHYVQVLHSANNGEYTRFFDGDVWQAWKRTATYSYGTEDMTAGTSALANGHLYFVYE